MSDELKAIEERLESIRAYPWTITPEEFIDGDRVYIDGPDSLIAEVVITDDTDQDYANGVFIAHAPADIAHLLAEVKRLREKLDFYADLPADAALSAPGENGREG